MFFDEKVVLFHINASTAEEVIRIGADELHRRGIVKDTFYEHVIEREKEYPTGLNTETYNIAIPHTDSEYVNRSQILFMSLENPVNFKAMDDDSVEVPVSLVFMIAMANKHEQVDTLSNLIGLCGTKEARKALYECTSVEKFSEIILANGME